MSYCSCSNWMLIANERLFHRIYYRIWLVSVTIDDSNLLHPKSIAFNWKMSVVWVLASMSANICIYFSTLDMHFPVTNNFESFNVIERTRGKTRHIAKYVRSFACSHLLMIQCLTIFIQKLCCSFKIVKRKWNSTWPFLKLFILIHSRWWSQRVCVCLQVSNHRLEIYVKNDLQIELNQKEHTTKAWKDN